eukprot:CAMPEP_0114136430 /NCGR_PEP_ID=MMETSP0043_2-20121206/15219_1 /TAXON_ID=464988 /ORGANISM="Hemiselmis andersenii, Strain CCMP644" /LENGTH=57 /DNA_ID=CAMNT_0001230201 /DNA_START=13 /DNA_END=189 /DNA_ORIENTATION=-
MSIRLVPTIAAATIYPWILSFLITSFSASVGSGPSMMFTVLALNASLWVVSYMCFPQ